MTQKLVEYLFNCSKTSLETYCTTRLTEAANLRKEMREVMEKWVKAEAEARLGELLAEHGEEIAVLASSISVTPRDVQQSKPQLIRSEELLPDERSLRKFAFWRQQAG